MIKRILFLKLAAFQVIVVLAIFHSAFADLNSNEDEARIFLQQTSSKLFNFCGDSVKKQFVDIDDSYDDDDELEVNENHIKFLKKIIEDCRKFDFKNFKDKELKYAFEMILKKADVRIIGEEKYLKLFDSLKKLDELRKDNFIDDFHDNSSEWTYSPGVENIIKISDDPEELKYYWKKWRKISGDWAEENLDITLEALKKAAELYELSPLKFWLREFNISEMEVLMTNLQPIYSEVHAFARNLLRKKYNESIITTNGLIPDHLFDQISYQIMTDKSIIEEIFSYKSLPLIELEKFNSTTLYKIAEQLFEHLGFEKYPSSIWEDQSIWEDRIKLYESKKDEYADDDEDDDECKPKVWYLTPNIYLEFCEQMDYSDFLDAYANMADIYYAKEMVGLPAYFFFTPNNLENGIEKAIILSSSTHHNLKAIGLISNDVDITHDVEMNRLLRMAINHLLNIPLDFVHAKVMADLVSGVVKKSELNKHYWKLMEKYAGVGPPEDHETDTYDLPIKFFEEMTDNTMSSNFLMEILSYQIYKKLCELNGEYRKGPLNLCDINGNKEAGNVLKKLMKLGISKPFNEVFASMFPENPTVRAEGLLEYYRPIKKFITEKNKEANVKLGWKS